VRWIEDRVRAVEPRSEGVALVGRSGAVLQARYVIAADGLHSPIRRQLGLDHPVRGARRYGVRRHYRRAPWVDRVEVHWADRSEAYVTPVAPDTVGVAFLFHKPARYDDLMHSFPRLAESLGDAAPTTAARGAGPFRQRAWRVAHGRVLLVGDAAGYLDPLTGEGVAIGVATARAAIAAIVADDPTRYPRGWRRATRRYFTLTAGLLAISRVPGLRRCIIPVVRRAPFVFDAALRLLGGRALAVPAPGAQPLAG